MSEKKGILNSFIHIGTGTLLNMVIGFITTPIITRLVLPEEYGRLSIFNLYISIAVMIMCLGLDQSLVRFYYKENTLNYKSWIIKRCSFLPLVLSFVVPAIVLSLIQLSDKSFEFSDTVIPLLLGIVGHMLFRFSILVLRLENKSKAYARINVINKALYALLAIGLIYITGNRSFSMLAYATVIAIIVASFVAIFEGRNLWTIKSQNVDFKVKFGELIKYGLPFILAMGLTTLFEAIDKLSLNMYCDYATVGIYAGAINIVNIFAIIQSTFNTLWAPVSIKHYEEKPEDKQFYSRCNLAITFIMFFCGFSLIAFKDVFGLLLGKTYREAAYIIPFLTLHPIMYTISETTVTGVVVKKKSYIHIIIAAISCLTNLIGNSILVPILGGKGAAISTGISYIVFYLLRTFFGMRYFQFRIMPFKFILISVVLIVNATYNTFASFGTISVTMYLGSIIILVLLYMDVVKDIANMMLSFLRSKR